MLSQRIGLSPDCATEFWWEDRKVMQLSALQMVLVLCILCAFVQSSSLLPGNPLTLRSLDPKQQGSSRKGCPAVPEG